MASLSMLGMEARAFLCCLDGVGREVVTGENQRNSYVGSSLLITKTICDKKNLVDHAQDKLMLSCLLSVAMSRVLAARFDSPRAASLAGEVSETFGISSEF